MLDAMPRGFWLYRAWTPLAVPEEGQGMVDYGLIIAAVAIAVIIAIFALGPKIASMFSQAGASLA